MLINRIQEMRSQIKDWKQKGLTIGFVPTMGALHEGHVSLIRQAIKENDRVVVSIFVNPTQFNDKEDFHTYPRTIEMDTKVCENEKVDAIFYPSVDELYSKKRATTVSISGLSTYLCGEKRPGHFDGVCLIITKIFNIIQPDKAYFGQKDAQQGVIIKRLVEDLNYDTHIIMCPIIREEDGLAKSSRNKNLSNEERKSACILVKSLKQAHDMLKNGEKDANKIIKIIKNIIKSEPLAIIDYIEIVDIDRLQPVQQIKDAVLVAIAVYIGKVRLIDNLYFEPTEMMTCC